MKKHLIYTNEIDRAYGSFDEAEKHARKALLEDHTKDEITDDMIWKWLYGELDIEAESFWTSVRAHGEGNWLVIADIGTWQGRRDGGNVFTCLSDALNAVCNNMDYITIEEDSYGSVRARCVHHDGTNHFDIYRLSNHGAAWYWKHQDWLDRQTLCETLAKPSNRRAGRLRKAFGWVA